MSNSLRSRLKAGVALAAIAAQLAVTAGPAGAFCGFYVAQADAKLFNKSSKVVLARVGERTAITMASDYQGAPNEFALVVPVPSFIEKDDVSVVSTKSLDHLDAYSAPRLVEYYDPNPCPDPRDVVALAAIPFRTERRFTAAAVPAPPAYPGVTVEARYEIAEYDISILSAAQSDGLIKWLTDNGYKIPAGAAPVIGSYIRQQMHFFLAKVNIKRMKELGRGYLQPLQVRYQTAKFMLPLRLGTVNAEGPQDLLVYTLTQHGRVEASNYRTVKVPSDVDVPRFVADDFPAFYRAAFERTVAREHMQNVFVEYAWDMGSCDPCAAPPMGEPELAELGTYWTINGKGPASDRWLPGAFSRTFVTRLHVRYDAQSFPEDLNFIETSDRGSFQARYVLHHPYAGGSCPAAATYRASLPPRFKKEAENLAALTGWPQTEIASRMERNGEAVSAPKP